MLSRRCCCCSFPGSWFTGQIAWPPGPWFYPDTLLDYLEALEGLEREEAGESYVHQEKKTDRLLRWLSGIPPYPAALERLERLGELYPRAGLLFRKIKDETVGKEAEWAVS